MELRTHIDKSRIAMTKTADGRIKVENREEPTDRFVWDFHVSPAEARVFGRELIRLADELDPSTQHRL